MKIRITRTPSGLFNGQPWPAVGQETDVLDLVAVGLLNGGFAEPVEETAKVEKAVAPVKATTRTNKKA